MKALTYIEHGKFALSEKPKPEIAVAVVVTMKAVGSVSMTAELTR